MADRVETPEEYVRRLMQEAGVADPDKFVVSAPPGGVAYNGRPAWIDPDYMVKVREQLDHAKYRARFDEAMRRVQTAQTAREKTLRDFSNADLVMEMLSRGFAVMKLPEDGGSPEVLKNG